MVPPAVTEMFPYVPGNRFAPVFPIFGSSVVGGVGTGGGGVGKLYGPAATSLFCAVGGKKPAPPAIVNPAGHAPVVPVGVPIAPPICVLLPFMKTLPLEPTSPPVLVWLDA